MKQKKMGMQGKEELSFNLIEKMCACLMVVVDASE